MKELIARLKLMYNVLTNKKIRKDYKLKKNMDYFYKRLKLGLWVLYLIDNKMDKLGFSREQKKQMRRSYFKDGLLSSKFMQKLINDTNIIEEIKEYERRNV